MANCFTDLLYLLLVPSSAEYIRFSLILTLFIPQLWYFRYSVLHSFDGEKHFGQFFCHIVKNYFAYATGQIDLLMKLQDDHAEDPDKQKLIPSIEKYKHSSLSLIVQDIPQLLLQCLNSLWIGQSLVMIQMISPVLTALCIIYRAMSYIEPNSVTSTAEEW